MAIHMMIRDCEEITYVSCVLCTRERNGYDDSDFYAVVWDEEAQRLKSVEYASTRYYTYGNHAEIDATDEVKAKATEWLFSWALNLSKEQAARKATQVDVGKEVKIIAGRKVAHGTVATVFWKGENKFKPNYSKSFKYYTVGIQLPTGERVFVDEKNVQVLDAGQYMPSFDELERQARQFASYPNQWHIPFVPSSYLIV